MLSANFMRRRSCNLCAIGHVLVHIGLTRAESSRTEVNSLREWRPLFLVELLVAIPLFGEPFRRPWISGKNMGKKGLSASGLDIRLRLYEPLRCQRFTRRTVAIPIGDFIPACFVMDSDSEEINLEKLFCISMKSQERQCGRRVYLYDD